MKTAEVILAGRTFVVTELTPRELARVAEEIATIRTPTRTEIVEKCVDAIVGILGDSIKCNAPSFPVEELDRLEPIQIVYALAMAVELIGAAPESLARFGGLNPN